MSYESAKLMLYPVTIIQDRYTGVYSGGEWIAVDETNYEVVKSIVNGSDTEAMKFKELYSDKKFVAVGETPNEAYQNLLDKNKDFEFPPVEVFEYPKDYLKGTPFNP